MKSSASKVLVVGLDGATFDLIDPWVKEGRLPTLAKCMNRGVNSVLLSSPLSNSAQAWSTFATGKNPGKHGIFDFFERVPGGYDIRFVNASFRRARDLWEIISDAGKRVVVMNVPMSYPPKEVNGIILSGLDAPGITDGFAYPPNIMEEIKGKIGSYILEPGIWGYIRQGKHSTALEQLLEAIKIRTETAKYLMSAYPWEFFMVVFTESDKVQHHFWKYMNRPGPFENAILEVYQHLDRSLRELLELTDERTQVYIISDHGAGPSTNKTFYINRWLNSEGFLKFDKPSMQARLTRSVIRRADSLVKTKLSRRAKEVLSGAFPRLRGKVESAVSLWGVDWASTKAYSRENHPAIFINLRGREPQGIVAPGDEYHEVREQIAQGLKSVVCPETGEKIIDGVRFREDAFWGEEINKAPDIIFEWISHKYIHRPSDPYSADGFLKVLSDRQMDISESLHRPSGVHRDEGILLAFGSGIVMDKRISRARLMDMAPTVLHALGISVSKEMDGKVLVDLFQEGFLEGKQVVYSEEEGKACITKSAEIYDTDEEMVIRERLRGLGYID